MNPDTFTKQEREMLLECITAIKKLPIYESESFEQIFGLTRAELDAVEANYPNWDLHDESVGGIDDSWLALNNSLAHLISNLNGTEIDKGQLEALMNKLRQI